MTAIDKVQYLQIGVQGENIAMNLEFDMTAWAEQYPDATFHILFKPYNETEVAPQASSYDSETKVLTWTVGAGATAIVGVGYTEIRAQDGEGLIKKTRVIPTAVENSVSGVEVNPPAAYADWVAQVLNAGAAVIAAAHGTEVSFSIGTNGHLIFSYTDEDSETITVDLGPVDAYGMAVEAGYQRTRTQFEDELANTKNYCDAAEAARDAAQLAQAAAELAKTYAQLFTGAPRTAATAAAMEDTDKIYVYTGSTGGGLTNGKWYYHNGTAWTEGGTYNSTALTTDTTLAVSGAAADAKVTGDKLAEQKSAFIDYQLGELPMFIVKDSYVKTDGTIASYTGWDRTEYVPVSKYHSMTVKSSVASDYNVFFDASYTKVGNFFGVKTTAKTIEIPSGAVYVIFSNTATGMQNLEVSFKTKAEQDIDDQGANLTNVNSILDGYNILQYELPSGSSVGTNWNNTYVKSIPSGTNLSIIFKGYSGSNFTRLAIFGQKLNDDYTEIKTIYSNTETEINIVTSEAYKNLYLSLVRSAAESPVSYTVYLKGDYGDLLGSDVIKMQVRSEGQDDRIKMLEAEQEQMVYTHFNLYDLCTFDDGYVYNSAGAKVSAEGNSVATPIRVLSGKTYYAKNTRCYFSFFIYDDGTNERIGESDSVYSGAFTPSKNGYAYLTTETGYKTSCVWTEDYSLYTSSRNATYFLPNKLELGIEGNHIFRVGTGREYTSILECLIAAEQYKNSIVYIDPGTYDMTQEFKDKYGNDYFTSENYLSQTNHRGCPLNNGVHVIGYGGVVVTGGLASTDSQDAIGDWSIFAAGDDTNGDNGYGFILENITVKSVSQHIRYLIHDEYGATDYNYINKYINCHFIVFPGYVKRCIGGGLGKHGYILIDNCTVNAPAYDATIRGINYHNDAGSGALNEIYIKNCYIPNGTVGITWYGQTPANEKSIMYVDNCYLQAEPVKKAETASAPYENVDIVSWRNTIVP